MQEVIILTKEKRNRHELGQEEIGAELNPDDLDLREDNDLTQEQKNNSRIEKIMDNKYNSKKGKQQKRMREH